MSKLTETNEKIANGVTEGFQKIEKGVVEGYKKIESGVVEGFEKISDKFVDKFLTKEGETVEEAKARLEQEQKDREAKAKADAEKRQQAINVPSGNVDIEKLQQEHKEMVQASIEKSMNAGKKN